MHFSTVSAARESGDQAAEQGPAIQVLLQLSLSPVALCVDLDSGPKITTSCCESLALHSENGYHSISTLAPRVGPLRDSSCTPQIESLVLAASSIQGPRPISQRLLRPPSPSLYVGPTASHDGPLWRSWSILPWLSTSPNARHSPRILHNNTPKGIP